MDQSNTIVVVSRHKKDVSWTSKLVDNQFRVLIYDHSAHKNHPYFVPKNKGREASVYIKYILDYYEHLTPYTVFIQDSEYSWHQDGSLVDLITNQLQKKIKFTGLNNKCMGFIKSNPMWPDMQAYWKKTLEPYFGDIEQYGNFTLGYNCCAQFIVNKNVIQKYPKEMYEKIYAYLMDDDVDEKVKGHMLEYTWNLMYNNPYKNTQKKLSKQEIAEGEEIRVKNLNKCTLIT